MDPLSDMLGGIRAEGAWVTQTVLEPPWAIRFTDGAPLTMLTVIRGGGLVILADGTELTVRAGDTALVQGPAPFHLADSVGTMNHPHRTYEIACLDTDTGPARTAGPGTSDPTTVMAGGYRATRTRQERLLRTLPPALVLHENHPDNVLWLGLARNALTRRHLPGGTALIDRVLDTGLACTLGCWFEQAGADAPGWYRGAMDPVAGPALEAIHGHPGAPWSVGSLAAEANVSRAHFAKRFTEVMGRPPLSYLTDWRMHIAEELLSDPDHSVADVAEAVGYRDPFAFSTAFKRLRGKTPGQFRRPAPRPRAGTNQRTRTDR
ncbi:AraC family transcriptional regulator [Yinghuangia sp. ASG 101]|uniref:helix-turn-helix transcriptional regulator n=1 Tax=Yinghuangia sp. ASG 101 TaxID=2896848 RepID=UPI001E2C6F9E|nr:AraC family transcriptional regulator [Yinghuangia sp. ASG 101]UGQ11323.1 AraC family transcriptional regulator [Yinghuangia sp. ASG 101]UGQ11373.1 AraC family transcriptional regulator [Yinghuangia sp. ASG 101]